MEGDFSRKERIDRKGWKRVRLGDVLSLSDGDWIESKDQSESGYRLIQTGNIGEGVFVSHEERARFVSAETFARLKCTEVFPGDCLISRLPDPVGRACILPASQDRMITAVDCAIARPIDNVIDRRFFVYFTSTTDYKRQMEKALIGSTRQRIGRKDLNEVLIPLPDIEIQEAIAASLSAIDKLSDSLQSLVTKYEAVKKATVNLLLKPKAGWKRVKLGDVAETSSGGTPSRNNESYYQGTIPWFTTSELRDEVLYDSKEHIRQEALQNSAAKVFPEGTLLLAMYGATIGKLGVLATPAATNQACCAIKCGSNIETAFLFQVLYSRRQEIIALGCGAGQPNISQLIVRNLNLVLPPLSEQRKIAKQIAAIDEVLNDCKRQLNKAQQLKQGMMSYFFG